MSEIPEHLLKRSKAAKSKKTGTESSESSAAESPATESSAVAPAAGDAQVATAPPTADLPYLDKEPEPERETPSYIKAAKKRGKIPFWAMPVVLATPVWAYGLAGTLQQPEVEDPLVTEAAEIYTVAGCSACHGTGGGGGIGYQLSDGAVIETFPEAIDMIVHVARGSSAINGETYGAERNDGNRRISGQRGNMPAQINALSLEELELVIYHERVNLGGEDVSDERGQEWAEHVREGIESGAETEIDLEFLLACANPDQTPGATGEAQGDESVRCPGPLPAEAEEE